MTGRIALLPFNNFWISDIGYTLSSLDNIQSQCQPFYARPESELLQYTGTVASGSGVTRAGKVIRYSCISYSTRWPQKSDQHIKCSCLKVH